MQQGQPPVPVVRTRERRISPRDVWTVVWVLLLVSVALILLYEIRRVLVWLLIAAFFAAVLSPAVAFLTRRGLRRGLAVTIVVIGVFLLFGALSYAFARPLVREAIAFAEDLPETIDRIRDAPIVRQLLERFNIQGRVDEVSSDLPQRLLGLSGPLLEAFRTVGELIIGLISIIVLMIFLLLYGPAFVRSGLDLIEEPARRHRVERVGADVHRAISGWVAGNLITSVVASVAALVTFLVMGIPYAALLALWVGVADLIPLVGATLGAIPAIIVAFIHSPVAGVVVTIFFILYQQFENHVLQPAVYGRTIKLNPFLVLLAVLLGVELAGFLGALFALPVAGAIQVIVNDLMRERRERATVVRADAAPPAPPAETT